MIKLLIVVFFNFIFISLINSGKINFDSKNVGIQMSIPRGQSKNEYLKSILDYWTSERMASAKSLHPTISSNHQISTSNFHQENQIEQILTESSFQRQTRSGKPLAVGRVFFTMDGLRYVCSGSVVNSKNRDMVITAGHCVFNTTSKKWADDFIFVPQYDSGEHPIGKFVWREVVTKQQWKDNADYNYDVAIVLMNVNDNQQHIRDLTGAFGISINPTTSAKTNAFGYPMNIENGEIMSTCEDTSKKPNLLLMWSFKGYQIECDMGGGASGGPWLHNYNINTHSGQQISVTSFSYVFAPGKIHGPYFNEDNIGTLFRQYENL